MSFYDNTSHKRIEMKKRIDRFLNRQLYSLYNLLYFSGLPIYAAVELLVERPLFCLPCWKRRLKEKYGINTFKEYKERTRCLLYKITDNPTSGFTQYYLAGLALLLYALPIYLVINVWMIFYGPQAFDVIGKHLIFCVGLGIVPSWILCDLVYWKKDRYLIYFAAFKKEDSKTKIVWTIGTTIALCLLIAANLFLMWRYACLYG